MTFEELAKSNETIKKTDVKGKEYAEVFQRVKAFRMLYPEGTITTDIASINEGVVIMRATVMDHDGKILGTGYAQEKENSTFINKTSYIENCETSAVGRALAMLGIGIDTSIASFEEVSNAILNQDEKTPKSADTKVTEAMLKIIWAELKRTGVAEDTICKTYKVNSLEELTQKQAQHCKGRLAKTKSAEEVCE